MNRCAIGFLIVAALLASCQPSTLISSLDKVIGAAEIALPVIGAATGISPQVMAGIVAYLQAVDAAVAQASIILEEPGTSAEKSARILQAFSNIASGCNCVPPGTPSAVVSVVQAVVNAVVRFLEHFNPPTASMTSGPVIQVKRSAQVELSKIRQRAEQHSKQLREIVAK